MLRNKLVLTIAVVFVTGSYVHAGTRYAKTNGATSGHCNSGWASACTLAWALSQASEGDEVWVQAGTYPPITLVNGVKVIGGFAGTETAASQSNPFVNVTTIDGNGSRAVTSVDHSPSTVLRGFRIINGRNDSIDWGGGGMLLEDSSALIVQCTFEDNTAGMWGGAVTILGNSSPQFINCKFLNNGEKTIGSEQIKTIAGGAVFLHNGSPKFTNCLFADNKAGEGCVLGTYSGSASFYNCTIVNNQATVRSAGGVFDENATVEFKNTILWGNTAIRGGDQIYNRAGVSSTVLHGDVQGGWTGTGNINSDPLFVPSTYKLTTSSPCKNVGNDNYLPTDVADLDWDTVTSEPVPIDLDGCPRKTGTVDMGAFEYRLLPCPGGGSN